MFIQVSVALNRLVFSSLEKEKLEEEELEK